jgi:ABC-type glycerol-3-phosphate transport system permease component
MIRRTTSSRIIFVGLCAITAVFLFPLLITLFASLKSNMEILTAGGNLFPEVPRWENYVEAWNMANFKRYTVNSLFVTSMTIAGILLVATMTGYAFSRGSFRGKNLLFSLFIATMFLSWGPIMIYPQLQVAKFLHIHASLWGYIILRVFTVNMTMIFLAKTYIDSVPRSLDEAARIDGCSFFRIYWNIILPLIKPIIATIALLTFGETWNDYLLPLVFTMSKPALKTLTVAVVGLKTSGQVASSWNLMLAGSMMSIIPMIILYFSMSNYFISGLTRGAIKE